MTSGGSVTDRGSAWDPGPTDGGARHSPLPAGEGPLSRATLGRELAELAAAGATVVEIEPNEQSIPAMGAGDQLNPEHIVSSAIAGRAQAAVELQRVRAAWVATP